MSARRRSLRNNGRGSPLTLDVIRSEVARARNTTHGKARDARKASTRLALCASPPCHPPRFARRNRGMERYRQSERRRERGCKAATSAPSRERSKVSARRRSLRNNGRGSPLTLDVIRSAVARARNTPHGKARDAREASTRLALRASPPCHPPRFARRNCGIEPYRQSEQRRATCGKAAAARQLRTLKPGCSSLRRRRRRPCSAAQPACGRRNPPSGSRSARPRCHPAGP